MSKTKMDLSRLITNEVILKNKKGKGKRSMMNRRNSLKRNFSMPPIDDKSMEAFAKMLVTPELKEESV